MYSLNKYIYKKKINKYCYEIRVFKKLQLIALLLKYY